MAGDRSSKEAKKPAVVVKQAATPLQLKGKVSKNQRAFERQPQHVILCGQGHKMVNVMHSGLHGNTMLLRCECSGYAPIDTNLPYLTRKPRISTATRARDARFASEVWKIGVDGRVSTALANLASRQRLGLVCGTSSQAAY